MAQKANTNVYILYLLFFDIKRKYFGDVSPREFQSRVMSQSWDRVRIRTQPQMTQRVKNNISARALNSCVKSFRTKQSKSISHAATTMRIFLMHFTIFTYFVNLKKFSKKNYFFEIWPLFYSY